MSHNTNTDTDTPAPEGGATRRSRPADPPAPLPFLCIRDDRPDLSRTLPDGPRQAAEHALDAIASISRRIDDLARELNLLGHFEDDDPNRPRAA